jgi:hypothetical protein
MIMKMLSIVFIPSITYVLNDSLLKAHRDYNEPALKRNFPS